LFFVEPEVKSQWTVLEVLELSALEVYLYTTMRYINRRFTYLLVLVDIVLSQQMLAVIKRVVDDNIICLSPQSSCMHQCMVRAMQLLRKTLNFISPELRGPQQLITRFMESTAA